MIEKEFKIQARFSNDGKFCDESCPQIDGDICDLRQDNGDFCTQLEYNEDSDGFERCETCKNIFGV